MIQLVNFEKIIGSFGIGKFCSSAWSLKFKPIPINLDVSKEFADTLELGEEISLKDQEGVNLAILIVEDIWYPDKLFEAEKVFGTTNSEHPGVNYLLNKSKNVSCDPVKVMYA